MSDREFIEDLLSEYELDLESDKGAIIDALEESYNFALSKTRDVGFALFGVPVSITRIIELVPSYLNSLGVSL